MNANATGHRRPLRLAWWNVLLGLWLALSPFLMAFSRNTALRWNNIAVGSAVIILALFSSKSFVRGLPVLLGAWMFASAFVLGFYRSAVLWNNLLSAALIIIGALASEAKQPFDRLRASARR